MGKFEEDRVPIKKPTAKDLQRDLDEVRAFFLNRANDAGATRTEEMDPIIFDKQAEQIFSLLLEYSSHLDFLFRGGAKKEDFENNLDHWKKLLPLKDKLSSDGVLLPLTPFELTGIYDGIVGGTFQLPTDSESFIDCLTALWVFYQCLPPFEFLNDDLLKINLFTAGAIEIASRIVVDLPALPEVVTERVKGRLGGKSSGEIRTIKSQVTHDNWQKMANLIWKSHPKWKNKTVAEEMVKKAKKSGDKIGNINTIRKSIKNPT